jgi:hypothetical protein
MESRLAPDGLTLHLDAVLEDVFEPEFVPDAPILRFEVFVADARVFGSVHLDAQRLTDLLNAHDVLHLHEATVESLVDGTTRFAEHILVPRAQLTAVSATGPRGDPALRRWTQTHAVAVQAGSYLIGGHSHAAPGRDPLASILERPAMVPLTDAWMEYWQAGVRLRQWIGTIIFNRDVADWVRVVAEEDLEFGRLRPTPSTA